MKQHLKRLTIPVSWPVPKKGTKYVTRPLPSKSFKYSLPLSIVFRDLLKIAKTAKEVKGILMNNYVFVDGIRRTDIKQTISFMETLEIKGTNDTYRLLINEKGKLFLAPIKDTEAKLRPSKIIGKKVLKQNKTMLNFLNGYNLVVDKDSYKVGDTLVMEDQGKKIKSHLKFEEGALVYLIGGSHVGKKGTIVKDRGQDKIIFKINGEDHKTSKQCAFIVGKDKSVIELNTEVSNS